MSLVIDGTTFDIPVIAIRRRADFLDKGDGTQRTMDGVLHRELIGVYFNYELQLGRTHDVTEYASLWDKLTEPEEFHEVTVPDESGNYTFTAYFSNVADELLKEAEAQNFWKNLTVNFIAKSPERTP